MLRLVNMNMVGWGEHRSGWPYCLESLVPIMHPDASVVFDDFIERTFLYDSKWRTGTAEHHYPWVGMFHHPPDMPDWYLPFLHLGNLDNDPKWQRSLPNLQLILATAPNIADWARQKWPHIPVEIVKHPTGRPICQWTADAFRNNRRRLLIQVGWFLRNTTAIYQAKCPDWLGKAVIRNQNHWVEAAHRSCFRWYGEHRPERVGTGQVVELGRLADVDYDLILSRNVVFMEVMSAAANNTVVECIIRNTPICINRHPGPEFYLGKDYPLFYDRFSQIPEVLTYERVLAANRYLSMMNKSWISGSMFREYVKSACIKHVPACRDFKLPATDTGFSKFEVQ